MELDALKSAWKEIATPIKTPEEIQLMLKENKHPVLKGIRKQLLIELIGWSAFLLVYYTMFDGEQKPILINMILVISVLFALIHNLIGYSLAKNLIGGNSIKASLQHYLSKMQVYAIISVISRVLLMGGFLLFFTYNISFTTAKYIMLAIIITFLLTIQLTLLCRVWLMRLKKLSAEVNALNDL